MHDVNKAVKELLVQARWPIFMAHGAARIISENDELLCEFLRGMTKSSPKRKWYNDCERHLLRLGARGNSLGYAAGALAQFPIMIERIYNENKITEG